MIWDRAPEARPDCWWPFRWLHERKRNADRALIEHLPPNMYSAAIGDLIQRKSYWHCPCSGYRKLTPLANGRPPHIPRP